MEHNINTTKSNSPESEVIATDNSEKSTVSIITSLQSLQNDSEPLVESSSLIGLPSKDETIAVSDNNITVPTLLIRNHDSEGRFTGEEYYPIAMDIPTPKDALVKNVTYWQAYSDEVGDFLLPVKGLGGGRSNAWNSTLDNIAKTVRCPFQLGRRQGRSGYEAEIDQFTVMPDYTPLSFTELLEKAFEGRVIDTADHPILKKLIS